MNLNLGCGNKRMEGYLNIDRRKSPSVDVIADLEYLPFRDSSISHIYCRHVLEHVDNFNKVIEEMWRISRPISSFRYWHGGTTNRCTIDIIVPFWAHAVANNDPDHKRSFGIFSFDNYTNRKNKTCLPNNKARFKILSKRYCSYNKLLERIANKYYKTYENNFAGMFPVTEVHFKLRVIK